MARVFAVAAIVCAVALTNAAAAEDFYKGKSIKIIVSSAAGGTYDANSRMVAEHWRRQIPGNPNIIVEFMPGADGLIATNHVYNIAPKDGLTVGLFNRNIVPAEILGNSQARFKADKFNWLGTTASFAEDAYLLIVRSSVPQKTVEEMRNARPPVVIGNAGTTIVHVLNEALALNLKIVDAYEKDTLDLAVERGEVDGESISWSALQSLKQRWIESSFFRPMIQLGRTSRLPVLAEVPTARELAKEVDARALIELAEAPMLLAYPFALPPGVPSDRVALLQTSFEQTMNDPTFINAMKAKKLEYSPLNGADLQRIIGEIAKTPQPVIDRFNALNKNRHG